MHERTRSLPRRTPTRAALLAGFAGAGTLAALVRQPARAGESTACLFTPAEAEGAEFVDARLNRADLVAGSDRPAVVDGVPLTLRFAVTALTAGICAPLAGAAVDLWHVDAGGVYSDSPEDRTQGLTFLRGYQITDANGTAAFRTIYPGWYHGRAVHVHVKVRTFTLAGSTAHQLTTQLFLDDALTDLVMEREPYNGRGPRDTTNARDPEYHPTLAVALERAGSGFAGTARLGLRMT